MKVVIGCAGGGMLHLSSIVVVIFIHYIPCSLS